MLEVKEIKARWALINIYAQEKIVCFNNQRDNYDHLPYTLQTTGRRVSWDSFHTDSLFQSEITDFLKDVQSSFHK